ncbi:DxFTY motif-containing membrane protein [Spiroplasma monobiae]|uniref:Transmembrane protein n=1 Tax=Spiroplasma monobiae MQ-1 TaxID=1336748 RepID=A0A2K9LU48_SPISQ|nr:hypothetical protein [Spiroplasma monobiae]AUM62586.1 hypothetical protein SMONO_v1c03370 [Spiroplasma monobiae MQ-1]
MKFNLLKEFNESRTPFFKSFGFLMIESIIPGIIVWFTVGFDFSFTLNTKLPNPHVGYVALICLLYFIYSFLITYVFYKLKWHESDNITFSQLSSIIFICIIMFGSFIDKWPMSVLLRIVLILLVVVVLTPITVFFATLIRNNDLKRKDDLEKIYEAYKKGDLIPNNKLLKAQRYQKFLLKKEIKKQELEKFKIELEEKIRKELEFKEVQEKEKIYKINKKLDEKENKKREKEKQKD